MQLNEFHDDDQLMDWPAQRASHTPSTNSKENSMIDWPTILANLAEPFPADALRYRAGAVTKDQKKAQALPYVESRAYEDRLNHIVPGSWHVEFEPWGETRLICRLTIHAVTRSSTGESSGSPKDIAGTTAEAQAFKRACSKFGLGRYLYDLPVNWIAYDADKRALSIPKTATPVRTPNPAQNTSATEANAVIGKERAVTMHRELAKLGLGRSIHYDFASRVLNYPVQNFAALIEPDAKAVWNNARQHYGGQQVSHTR